MADYRTYLASNILTEDKVVTYRLLSRALKVHVNAAKEMLFDFHRQQNAKKPGTIHATYLLNGTKHKEEPVPTINEVKDGEDDYMQSSPYMASSMPQPDEGTGETSVLSITLVKEENLDEVRSQYEHISSIHIYSLGPHPLKDLQMLSDVNREVQQLCISEDVLEFAPKYGTITNKNAKRRTSRRPPPPGAAPLPTKAGPLKPKTEVKEALKPAAKQENKSSQSSTAQDFFGKGKAKEKVKSTGSAPSSKESTPVPAAAAAPPALKRDNSSIFKSFAKAKPKLKREETDSSAAADSPAEDSPMKDVSDDEEETYVPPVVTEKDKEVLDTDRAARKAREAALKAMMDDSDEEEAPVLAKKETKAEKVEKDDVEMKEPTPAAPVVTDGRRRGRRRVMKKRTVKDEDGYLVTKEEPVWESFSEDEPVEKPKPKPQSFSTTTKPKKGAAKAGQGNIMSFFGKK